MEIKNKIENLIAEILKKQFSSIPQKQTIKYASNGNLYIACTFCGDSKTNLNKKRCCIYLDTLSYYCFNCSASGNLIYFFKHFGIDSYDLLYTIYIPSFITQIVSEDSIIKNISDDRIKWKKVETDTINGISKIEVFYENLNLNELIQKDSTMKFFKSKDYIEFYKFLTVSDTLTKNLLPLITDENYYKITIFSRKEILQSNADSISKDKVIWKIPLRKLYEMKKSDTIKIVFRIKV